MNFFFCNRYDTKKEDIYILAPNLVDDNNKISFYDYEKIKKLKKLVTNRLANYENERNISKNIEDTDELQVIDYPYQPQQNNYNLNTFYSNKSQTNNSFIENNNIDYLNFFSIPKNSKDKFYKKKIIKDFNETKFSFSFLSNSNEDSINNKITNKILFENSDCELDDTIKGEDNINLSKLQLRNDIKMKKEKINIKKIPNRISNKNNNKFNYKNSLIKHGDLDINKFVSQNDFRIKRNKLINQSIRRFKNNFSKIKRNRNIKPKINNISKSSKNYLKTSLKNKSSSLDIKSNNISFSNSKDYILSNFSKNNKQHVLINKHFSNNKISINDYKQKEDYHKKLINDNKKLIEAVKRKIKNNLIITKYQKNYKSKNKKVIY